MLLSGSMIWPISARKQARTIHPPGPTSPEEPGEMKTPQRTGGASVSRMEISFGSGQLLTRLKLPRYPFLQSGVAALTPATEELRPHILFLKRLIVICCPSTIEER